MRGEGEVDEDEGGGRRWMRREVDEGRGGRWMRGRGRGEGGGG